MNELSGIEKLLAEKQHHTEELNRIDSILQQISALLGVGSVAASGKRRGRPPKSASAPTPKAALPPTPPLKGKRRWFSRTAEESILDFVGKGPMTAKQINGLWKGEGRSGKADNSLSHMVKVGKLKRNQIDGKARGSTYSVV